MPDYEVKIDNIDKIIAQLKKFPQTTEKYVQKAIVASAAEVQKEATRGVVPWKTGNLVKSIGPVIGRLYASVAPNRLTPAKYAWWVHEGTGIYGPNGAPIVAKSKKGMFWPGAKHPVHSIKGQKANRFMPKILEKANAKIQGHFQKALELIIKEIQSF